MSNLKQGLRKQKLPQIVVVRKLHQNYTNCLPDGEKRTDYQRIELMRTQDVVVFDVISDVVQIIFSCTYLFGTMKCII